VAPAADELAPLLELARRIRYELVRRGATLATAESCTGGLIGHLLTEIPGSSDYYVGGLVSYSDGLKRDWLGVDERILHSHGAVSAQACVAMAEGARSRYTAALAVSATGIAGPSGGTDAKPVGLTYVGVADDGGHDVRRFVWEGDRHANKLRSAEAALSLVLERVGARGG
jgi:PncC family amidohydrolase